MNIIMIVEEIAISCRCSISYCRSTAYRTLKRVNKYLEDNKYLWRVKLIKDNSHLYTLEIKEGE